MKAIKAAVKKTASVSTKAAAAPRQPAKTSAPKTKKKSAAKSGDGEQVAVPPILLEGDQSPSAAVTGPGQRYVLGPTPPPAHAGTVEQAELPDAYGTKRLMLTARDPHWLYARWDFTKEQQRKFNSASIDKHLVLRIFLNEAKGQPFSQVHVHPESTHWFVHVAHAGAKYVGEIGYYTSDAKWTNISTSTATLTPPDAMSEDTSVQFTAIPLDVPFDQLIDFARSAVKENVPLAEIFQQLQASGYNLNELGSGEKWTPAREKALAAIIKMDSVRRVWMGSVEVTELVRRQLQHEISSLGLTQFSVAGSWSGALPAGVSSFSSLSSPFGGVGARQKSFWFNVNAELILYGATEPDAEVTIGGRVIKLRPDGTFSYRFALPDGQYHLPAIAVSSDKTDSREADLRFSRSTQYHGDVGRHPQDAALRPPLVEHVA